MKKALFTLVAPTLVSVASTSAVGGGSLTIVKYEDVNNNGQDNFEPRLPGWVFKVTDPQGNSQSVTTDDDGTVTISVLVFGNYTVTETLQDGWKCTDPGAGLQKIVTVNSGDTVEIKFGNYQPPPPGTGTPGYWKNHPDAWPVAVITIGGETYTKGDAIAIM